MGGETSFPTFYRKLVILPSFLRRTRVYGYGDKICWLQTDIVLCSHIQVVCYLMFCTWILRKKTSLSTLMMIKWPNRTLYNLIKIRKLIPFTHLHHVISWIDYHNQLHNIAPDGGSQSQFPAYTAHIPVQAGRKRGPLPSPTCRPRLGTRTSDYRLEAGTKLKNI